MNGNQSHRNPPSNWFWSNKEISAILCGIMVKSSDTADRRDSAGPIKPCTPRPVCLYCTRALPPALQRQSVIRHLHTPRAVLSTKIAAWWDGMLPTMLDWENIFVSDWAHRVCWASESPRRHQMYVMLSSRLCPRRTQWARCLYIRNGLDFLGLILAIVSSRQDMIDNVRQITPR